MKSENAKSLRSYHGNHSNYITKEYTDDYGNPCKKEVCYFNQFYEKGHLNEYCKDFRHFDYLFKQLLKTKKGREEALLPENKDTIKNLKALAALMIDDATKDPDGNLNSITPPGYTYWGQFLDHDITAGTDRSHEFTITQDQFNPVLPNQVVQDLENMRTPFFDLDSLYGDSDGPFGAMFRLYDPHDVVKLRVDMNDDNSNIPGSIPNPELGLERDLPRNNDGLIADTPPTFAIIGDARNDENTVVAQFHLALLKFHNCVVDEIRSNHPLLSPKALFHKARKEVTHHYQWLILNDFLKRILDDKIYGEVFSEFMDADAPNIFEDLGFDKPFMPLEFSTAAYRFGHSMVRNTYDFNQNFGDRSLNDNSAGEVLADAPFGLLFAFTGKGGERLKNTTQPTIRTTLPFNWIIEWERFFDTDITNRAAKRFARKIDTKLALPLRNIQNNDFDLLSPEEQAQVNVPEAQFNNIMRHLAERNLLRGYLLSIPTAQAIIDFLSLKGTSIEPLSETELKKNNSAKLNKLLVSSGFLYKTPLWYYILKEAEVRNDGNKLGRLGSYIIGRTFVALLKMGGKEYCNPHALSPSWKPEEGIVASTTGKPFRSIMDLLRFAKVAVPLPHHYGINEEYPEPEVAYNGKK